MTVYMHSLGLLSISFLSTYYVPGTGDIAGDKVDMASAHRELLVERANNEQVDKFKMGEGSGGGWWWWAHSSVNVLNAQS